VLKAEDSNFVTYEQERIVNKHG